jgi:hypothetical protein
MLVTTILPVKLQQPFHFHSFLWLPETFPSQKQQMCFVLFCFLKTGSLYVAQAGLELMIFLPQPPKD